MIVGIVVWLPVLSLPVCLPILFRLWRPKTGVSKMDHGVVLVKLLAAAFTGRRIHVTGDAAYHGPACKQLPGNVTWTCRLQRNAVLHDLAPPRTGRRGRPALKGQRLGVPADLAATLRWKTVTVQRYGRLSPWYVTKTEPAFEDMLIKLRRTLIAARFMAVRPAQPTAQEIAAVQQAWTAATA